jgi:hypothetical protein
LLLLTAGDVFSDKVYKGHGLVNSSPHRTFICRFRMGRRLSARELR